LFLDELPEFKRDVLESLRQPLETGEILIARANAHLSYPAKFLLVAAANPCNCGMMFDPSNACNRAPLCGEKYMERLSGPLLDRFSLRLMVPATDAISLGKLQKGETSETVRKRVSTAREMQYMRNGQSVCNEDLDSAMLDLQMKQSAHDAQSVLEKASQRFSLSPRGYYRMIKTARTIADLDGSEVISANHIAETALYRMMEGSRLNYDVNKRLASV
jgi:magnesium chelatase family protein